MVVSCKEATDGACALEGAGEVVAPGIRSMKVEGRRMKGAFGEHLPAVPEEPGIGGGGEFGAVPVEDFLSHAPPGVVVGELEPLFHSDVARRMNTFVKSDSAYLAGSREMSPGMTAHPLLLKALFVDVCS